MKIPVLSLLILSLAVCVSNAPAQAKKPDFNGGHGNPHKDKDKHNIGKDETGLFDKHGLFFADDKKVSIRIYLRENYRPDCPPGLAKKRNGCLPPGQAKKYAIGGMIPHGYGHPPAALLELLGPPPAGAFYAMVDKDVLLVSEATKKILDAVTLLSALD